MTDDDRARRQREVEAATNALVTRIDPPLPHAAGGPLAGVRVGLTDNWQGDSAAGDTTGQGVQGAWRVLTADGTRVTTPAPRPEPASRRAAPASR
jgi:aspartyl-tRNA(Asn)/glutamyl-tRNA(Gln) amidotransferase subunit A